MGKEFKNLKIANFDCGTKFCSITSLNVTVLGQGDDVKRF